MKFEEILFYLSFLIISACGGSVSGGDSSQSSNNSSGIVIETLPGKDLIEYAYTMESPPGDYIYYGTNFAIVEVNKSTGYKRTLIGNLLQQSSNGESGSISYPHAPVIKNGYIYSADSNGKVFRLNGLADNFTSVEMSIPNRSLIGCCNFDGITGNSTHLFYYKSNGTASTAIYKKAYSSLAGPEFVVTIPGTITVVAGETHLYITNAEVSEKNLYRYDLLTGDLSIIQANLSSLNYVEPPIAKFGTNIYWVNGLSIYMINENDNLYIIHVVNENDKFLYNEDDGEALEYLFEVSKKVGANLTVIRAKDVIKAISDFAISKKISNIVIGSSPNTDDDQENDFSIKIKNAVKSAGLVIV